MLLQWVSTKVGDVTPSGAGQQPTHSPAADALMGHHGRSLKWLFLLLDLKKEVHSFIIQLLLAPGTKPTPRGSVCMVPR